VDNIHEVHESKIQAFTGKDNVVAEMLLQVRYDDEEIIIDDKEDLYLDTNFYSLHWQRKKDNVWL